MQEAIQDMKHSKPEQGMGKELGIRLRRAREAAHLTQQEVAQRLHLRLSVVAAIESDRHEVLPAPTFVKGYLRMYCRLVGICPEEIIQLYNQCSESHTTNLTTPVSLEKPTKTVGAKAIKYLIMVILLALMVIAIRWLYLQNTISTVQPVTIQAPAPVPVTATNPLTDNIIKVEPVAVPPQQQEKATEDEDD